MNIINITPDKTLFPKLWSSWYTIPQALAELIDNSIDARVENWMEIHIKLFSDKITIADRGVWMNFDQIKDAITLAKSNKSWMLWEFWLWLKTACLSLWNAFKIISKKLGENLEYRIDFDTNKWLKDDIWEIEVSNREVDEDKHYTIIEITDLKSKSLSSAEKKLKDDIQMRFWHYLDDITIKVNDDRVLKKEPIMSDWTIQDINIKTKYWIITWWVWLMKDSSQKWFYWLHTYRNNRLILPYNKIWFTAHPTVARIFWELHLDFVPVTHNKKSFELESEEYKHVEFLLESELKNIKFEARKKKSEELQTQNVKDQTEVWWWKTSEAMKQVIEKISDEKINKTLPKNDIVKTYIDDEIDEISLKSEIKIPVSNYDDIKWKIIKIDFVWQVLSFIHLYDSIWTEKWPKSWKYISSKKLIVITTNMDFPTYFACKDLPFLALINISESLTEFLLEWKENQNSLKDYKNIFNMIMRIASEKKEELE